MKKVEVLAREVAQEVREFVQGLKGKTGEELTEVVTEMVALSSKSKLKGMLALNEMAERGLVTDSKITFDQFVGDEPKDTSGEHRSAMFRQGEGVKH